MLVRGIWPPCSRNSVTLAARSWLSLWFRAADLRVETPNIDRIAREGACFSNGAVYCGSTVTLPLPK